jgi:hypothetical protein
MLKPFYKIEKGNGGAIPSFNRSESINFDFENCPAPGAIGSRSQAYPVAAPWDAILSHPLKKAKNAFLQGAS